MNMIKFIYTYDDCGEHPCTQWNDIFGNIPYTPYCDEWRCTECIMNQKAKQEQVAKHTQFLDKIMGIDINAYY